MANLDISSASINLGVSPPQLSVVFTNPIGQNGQTTSTATALTATEATFLKTKLSFTAYLSNGGQMPNFRQVVLQIFRE